MSVNMRTAIPYASPSRSRSPRAAHATERQARPGQVGSCTPAAPEYRSPPAPPLPPARSAAAQAQAASRRESAARSTGSRPGRSRSPPPAPRRCRAGRRRPHHSASAAWPETLERRRGGRSCRSGRPAPDSFQIGRGRLAPPRHQVGLPAPAVHQVAEDIARLVADRQRLVELRHRDIQIAMPAAHHPGEEHAGRLGRQMLDLAAGLMPCAAASNAASNSPCMP